MSFEERMQARKDREMAEQAEREKMMGELKLSAFPVKISMNILAPDWSEAEITLNMLIENMNKFDDLSDVKGID